MKNWIHIKANNFIDFNPRLSIKKGTLATKIAMDKLQPFTKKIPDIEKAEFAGGTKFCNGDTIMARITPCLENGKTAFVDVLEDGEVGFGSTEFIVLRAKNGISDPQFVYYLATSPAFRDVAIKSMVGSSGRQRVQQGVLDNLELIVPPLPEQKRIGGFLALIDEKIALNNKINNNLYELLQLSFENDYLEKCQLNSDWETVTLDFATSRFGTGLNPRKNFVLGHGSNYYVTIKNMGNNRVYLDERCDKVDDEAIRKIQNRSDLQVGDLLFSGIGTIGRVYLIDKPVSNWNTSESVFNLRPNYQIVSSEFLFLLLLNRDMQEYAVTLASGSVQKGIRMADLKRYKFILPSKDTMDSLTQLWKPIISKIKSNEDENDRLSALRDTLLPKLMSGEIDVTDLDI